MTYKRLFRIPVINVCICVPKRRKQRKREYLTYAAALAFIQCGGDGLGICKRVGIQVQTLDKITRTPLWNEALDFYGVKVKELRNDLYFQRLNAYLEARRPRGIGDLKLSLRVWTDLFLNGEPDPDTLISHPLLHEENNLPEQIGLEDVS